MCVVGLQSCVGERAPCSTNPSIVSTPARAYITESSEYIENDGVAAGLSDIATDVAEALGCHVRCANYTWLCSMLAGYNRSRPLIDRRHVDCAV